ncbi:purple acid phosphatase family protein [Carnobacterium inhibens]|uniref:purple acid phosphatase family protein n=1 Tax=Carnobacterium inhibens TaxID=147709 RepID=UPI00203C3BAE|nr:metallophosphoesterase family protein [Carnobacterium inhibens]MCM3512130.1 metallophosphoesterase family protein [Carnobacterium inhibens]
MYLKRKMKRFSVSSIAAVALLATFVLAGCQSNAASSTIDSSSMVSSSSNEVELVENKPEVAEVEANNAPNRIITTLNGDTQTQMGFNWYTTDKFDDAKVWVSISEDLSDPLIFDPEVAEVTNQYAERTEDGYYIYADLEKDDEGDPVEGEDGEPIINGYYTDENVSGPEWTSGDAVGSLDLVDVTEYSYKALATDLEPNTTYYYQVGSDSGEKSEIGTFNTSGEVGDEFTFVQYTDTQNAYWNEHVFNEAAYGADTIKQALEVADADFVLHTGDVVETAEVEDEWIDIFSQSEESWLQQPLVVAPGNHDEYALNYGDSQLTEKFNEHINVPVTDEKVDGGSYYSLDYNGVHVVVANTNDNKESEDNPEGKAIGTEQLAWIEEDIKQARENGAQWVVLTYHKPLYSKSYHSLQDEDVQKVREEFMQMIDELDVDLALQGHDHVISRTKSLNFTPTEENFSNATIDQAEVVLGEDNVEYYKNPSGTVFVLPNTGGTKAYDDLYGKSLEHVHEVRPDLSWMTQEDLDYYNNLFAFGGQPQKDGVFANSHSNNRDSTVQNFAVYNVNGNELTVEIYQIFGELVEGEERAVEKVHEFGIVKE